MKNFLLNLLFGQLISFSLFIILASIIYASNLFDKNPIQWWIMLSFIMWFLFAWMIYVHTDDEEKE